MLGTGARTVQPIILNDRRDAYRRFGETRGTDFSNYARTQLNYAPIFSEHRLNTTVTIGTNDFAAKALCERGCNRFFHSVITLIVITLFN